MKTIEELHAERAAQKGQSAAVVSVPAPVTASASMVGTARKSLDQLHAEREAGVSSGRKSLEQLRGDRAKNQIAGLYTEDFVKEVTALQKAALSDFESIDYIKEEI